MEAGRGQSGAGSRATPSINAQPDLIESIVNIYAGLGVLRYNRAHITAAGVSLYWRNGARGGSGGSACEKNAREEQRKHPN